MIIFVAHDVKHMMIKWKRATKGIKSPLLFKETEGKVQEETKIMKEKTLRFSECKWNTLLLFLCSWHLRSQLPRFFRVCHQIVVYLIRFKGLQSLHLLFVSATKWVGQQKLERDLPGGQRGLVWGRHPRNLTIYKANWWTFEVANREFAAEQSRGIK